MRISELIGWLCSVAFLANVTIWPIVLWNKLETILYRIHHLEYEVSLIAEPSDPDDPDGDEEDEPEAYSNVTAIGKRAA